MEKFSLSLDLILIAILCGTMLSIIYFSLLWYTTKRLPNVKNKTFLLFLSYFLRLGIFLFVSIWFAKQSPIQFLWMFMSFVVTKFIIVPFLKDKEKLC